MITFDVLTLGAFLNENSGFITGARINKIQQPTRREFVFTLRNNSESKQFYVNINPQFYHCCFMSKTNAQKRVIEIPAKPPMFCMLLRKYLENSKIAKAVQPEGERILEFYIETYNEIGDKIYLCLAFEFMGKHSNVILYNCDTELIIGCAHNVGLEKSREREIYGGIPYVYPPKNRSLKSWTSLMENLPQFGCVNEMIDDYFAGLIAQDKFKTLKNNYHSNVLNKLKKVKKSLLQINNQLNLTSDADKYRLYGDLLMANLYNLSDYKNSVEVFDYENDKEISIELDSLLTIKENANRFYKLYNKAKTSRLKLSEIIEKYETDRAYLEQVLYSIDTANNMKDLDEIAPEIGVNISVSKSSKKTIDIEQILLDDGGKIYIGKNNRQNDYIVSKLADEEDLWFHVHNCAGAHILLKTKNVTDELILQCAKLAKEYSAAKNSKAGVIYTKRKYLRKPPGANLGYVTYKNEKEIIID